MIKARYYVRETDLGYVIQDVNKVVPLPFTFMSKNRAFFKCYEFNKNGPQSVREFYYIAHVAGKGISKSYKEWMEKNKEMFE